MRTDLRALPPPVAHVICIVYRMSLFPAKTMRNKRSLPFSSVDARFDGAGDFAVRMRSRTVRAIQIQPLPTALFKTALSRVRNMLLLHAAVTRIDE